MSYHNHNVTVIKKFISFSLYVIIKLEFKGENNLMNNLYKK